MKYLFLLLILLAGCQPLRFYPQDGYGGIGWKIDNSGETICDINGKKTGLFKIDNKGRIWGSECYKEKILGL